VRIVSIATRSRIAAMIFSPPPTRVGQLCRSMSNTRFSSRAQPMCCARACTGFASPRQYRWIFRFAAEPKRGNQRHRAALTLASSDSTHCRTGTGGMT